MANRIFRVIDATATSVSVEGQTLPVVGGRVSVPPFLADRLRLPDHRGQFADEGDEAPAPAPAPRPPAPAPRPQPTVPVG
jgi:hypothetical protein